MIVNTKINAYVNILRINAKTNDGMSASKAKMIENCETSNSFYTFYLHGSIQRHKYDKMTKQTKKEMVIK